MYRIRLGCVAYARMNISPDQARRMMYIVGKDVTNLYLPRYLSLLDAFYRDISQDKRR